MDKNDVVIVSAQRTALGAHLGALSLHSAPRLGGFAIAAACKAAKIPTESVDQVIMGNVLQAGVGQAPARQAMIHAGLHHAAGAVTVNKVCGSGMRAIMDAANGIRAGEWRVVVAGGMESMSNAPHFLENSRRGVKLGDMKLVDAVVKDGLWDPYHNQHMGQCAEACASKFNFDRKAQDDFAIMSYERARAATQSGGFTDEIVPIEIAQPGGDALRFERDESPFAVNLEKMPRLKPAFSASGTITAGNASSINDGAAALVITSAGHAATLGLKPLARLVSQATFSQEPEWFTTAPIGASRKAMERANLPVDAIGLWEINEAFAVVAMAAVHDMRLDIKRVNVHGGAVALGHPIGCSGARIITTLVHALRQKSQRYGCATICIGGGEATAMIIENLDV